MTPTKVALSELPYPVAPTWRRYPWVTRGRLARRSAAGCDPAINLPLGRRGLFGGAHKPLWGPGIR
jgi:hypothetical protein